MQDHGFLHQALIYLAAGVIAVPLFKRLGLGSVLGYLIAGMAIGPWGLKLVSAARGDPRLRRVRRRAAAVPGRAGAQSGARLAAAQADLRHGRGAGAGRRSPWSRRPAGRSASRRKVALVAGMGFAMSSTAIGLATLQEKNLLPTPGGQASFSVLLFQDLAVIPMLLLLAFMQSGKNDAADFEWAAAGKAVGHDRRC